MSADLRPPPNQRPRPQTRRHDSTIAPESEAGAHTAIQPQPWGRLLDGTFRHEPASGHCARRRGVLLTDNLSSAAAFRTSWTGNAWLKPDGFDIQRLPTVFDRMKRDGCFAR